MASSRLFGTNSFLFWGTWDTKIEALRGPLCVGRSAFLLGCWFQVWLQAWIDSGWVRCHPLLKKNAFGHICSTFSYDRKWWFYAIHSTFFAFVTYIGEAISKMLSPGGAFSARGLSFQEAWQFLPGSVGGRFCFSPARQKYQGGRCM